MWCDVCWLQAVVSCCVLCVCDCMLSKCDVVCGGRGVIAVWLPGVQCLQVQHVSPSRRNTHGVDSVCQSASATANVCARQAAHLLSPVQHKLKEEWKGICHQYVGTRKKENVIHESGCKESTCRHLAAKRQQVESKWHVVASCLHLAPKRQRTTPATQSEGKCHTCHAKWRWMSPSATPATQSEGATQTEGGCDQVTRRPRKVQVDVTKCRACHTKWRWLSRSATPAMQRATATTRATRVNPVP